MSTKIYDVYAKGVTLVDAFREITEAAKEFNDYDLKTDQAQKQELELGTVEVFLVPLSPRLTGVKIIASDLRGKDNGFSVVKYKLERKLETLGYYDFHYQNQTDRPDDVTAREWSRRRKLWDKATADSWSYNEFALRFNVYNSELWEWDVNYGRYKAVKEQYEKGKKDGQKEVHN